MKLFLKEHVPFILFSIISFLTVVSVFWLDGYHQLSTVLYALFLGLFLLTAFLIILFYRHSKFYRILAQGRVAEVNELPEMTALQSAVKKYLQTQKGLSDIEIEDLKKKRKEHAFFMNQWVHQMKAPLSVIDLLTAEQEEEFIWQIRKELNRLETGLQMVLHASRLDVFEADFKIEKANVNQLVNKVISDHKRLFIVNGVFPENHISHQLTMYTDVKWLQFAIGQVIVNAVRYSKGYHDKIYFYAKEDDKKITIEIIDKGIGIRKEDLKRIKRPFFTGENGRNYKESTGMGLYFVSEIVSKLDLDFQIDSEERKGTTVRFIYDKDQ
ncbi:sensor histidine kinase [Bacillus aquiflavi]|uniref:histidine kinase n=1 Tax=Bacillus aquiflavi TaxID=2672567 RepID=A0A6B3VWU0_9BACI|nr:sensor histidine kinase [Bacillus aquiflavi]MBA4536417.1 sensor histidine kinase [Bacillus aquiflavi]NEY80785.1 HAMP domain-containing histidine kinase [Bacillus aquiflavi]UAC49125.1 sensor histidine kinase [Bacillus aquiflavi]